MMEWYQYFNTANSSKMGIGFPKTPLVAATNLLARRDKLLSGAFNLDVLSSRSGFEWKNIVH
jgi:hypothetical protein